MRFETGVALFFALALGSAAFAQDGARQGGGLDKRFKELDKDGDGKVSAEELGNPALHKRLDKDGDGFVTLAEAREAVRSGRAARELAPAPPATVPQGVDVNAKPSPPPAEPPVSKSTAFTGLAFSRDCEPGTKDADGRLVGGTETMRFLCHRGKLFAGTGCWMDLPYGPRPEDKPAWTGPQILVKESAAAPWRVDVSFPLCVRVDAMVSATFTTDGTGKKLEPPVTLLIASPSSVNTATWTRDDASGTWTEVLAVEGLRGGIRSFCAHADKATGIRHLFGGGTKGVIFRAS
ncbi:MAG: EF-hand domain-containing protein, partial [Planctomycetes bacterium]|nr:EF-hand domain-containing protein [Planctomycetota bacterium]